MHLVQTVQIVKCHSSSWKTYLRATKRYLPYGITLFYLPPNTGERDLARYSKGAYTLNSVQLRLKRILRLDSVQR